MLHTVRWSCCTSTPPLPAPATTAGARTTSASSSTASPRGHSVDEAAKSLGHSRQSAYALRRRAGAEGFAQAWDAAQALGRQVWQAKRSRPGPELTYAFDTMLVPRFYRGRLIGFVQRKDNVAALRALADLDRHIDDQRKLSKLTR